MFTINELDLLRRLVMRAAVDELMSRFESVSAQLKADGSLITAADLAMQTRLQADLAKHWPHYVLLGEEMAAYDLVRTRNLGTASFFHSLFGILQSR